MSLESRFSLVGRRALVTGSSRGIGKAIALGLAEAGADVAVHYAGNVEAAQQVADQIRDMGRRTLTIQANLADEAAPRQIADTLNEAWHGVDIAVHNASVQYRQPWDEIPRERFDEQVVVNIRAVFELTQLLTPGMIERGWGRVLMIGSVQQLRQDPKMPIYSATKSMLDNLTHNLGRHFARHGVTVNNLAPGFIDTDRNRAFVEDQDLFQRVLQGIPMRRAGTPEDCVGAALLLCSQAGSYITGQTFYVDGGLGA